MTDQSKVNRAAVDQEFQCEHGVVFARRDKNGGYAGQAPESACTACAVRSIFGIGPSQMIPAQKDVRRSIDLDVHAERCPHRFDNSSFRYHTCPLCNTMVDTFGGNVD